MGKIILFVTILFFISCSNEDQNFNTAVEKLLSATEVHYLSLRIEPNEKAKDYFYRWEILGKTKIEKEDLKSLLNELRKGYEEGKKSDYSEACFDPRHILKINSQEKVEILICFSCSKMKINLGQESFFNEIRMKKDLFNQVAKKYKLKLEKP